jgi:CRP-like cAMP-binding protein
VTDDAAALLRKVPLFRDLSNQALSELTSVAHVREARPGKTFFQEGNPAESFFVVRTGTVKLSQLAADGQLVVLRLIGPGDAFGGAAAFGGGLYPATAEAVTAASAFEWPGGEMASLMERHPRLAINVARFIAARLHELQTQYRQLATEKVERRVARALLRLVQQAGRRVETGVTIDLPLSREDIAQMTGTTLYTVSRILSRWESEGIVDSVRQRVTVLTPHALVTLADELD